MANTTNPGGMEQAKGHMEESKSHLQQAGTQAKEAAGSTISGVTQKAQDIASGVSQRAHEAAATAERRTDDALGAVGQRMSGLGSSLRQTAPREGVLGSAAGGVADRLESGGRYLQEHGVSEITEDLAGVIRRNPVPSIFVAFGLGFFIGMVSSSRRR